MQEPTRALALELYAQGASGRGDASAKEGNGGASSTRIARIIWSFLKELRFLPPPITSA
jgi:hypothetical protein